ncbi:MAG: uracil-DNA glycosylase [Novosphingobium sp.]|nr:uracil-DNA glycosylase [Novosphingobium sp.]
MTPARKIAERVHVELDAPDDFAGWRERARALVAAHIAPEHVSWSVAGGTTGDLFATMASDPPPEANPAALVRASARFLDLAKTALLHRAPERFSLLYNLLWRLQANRHLMDDAADGQVRELERLARTVRRDIHKMRAFVRFRSMRDETGNERFIAWFEPEHHIVRANAAFFVDRFANQQWSILTPSLSLHWDGSALQEGPADRREDAPDHDATEAAWQRYYASIFNPARLKVGAMLKEMPRKYWKDMPETRLIPGLIAGAQAREAAMIAIAGEDIASSPMPASLADIAEGISACSRCPIGCNGTRAVPGEGPTQARLLILGEQPGDTEETTSRPFVGPAGAVLDTHLAEAGIDRSAAYLTNAVKHFKFLPRGKKRLHQNPSAREIDHCRWWLDAERALVRPDWILALGASAGRALLGRTPSVGRERGVPVPLPDGTQMLLTAHPSYLLRLEGEARERETARFVQDLKVLAEALSSQHWRPELRQAAERISTSG